jgi:hypothetical protein
MMFYDRSCVLDTSFECHLIVHQSQAIPRPLNIRVSLQPNASYDHFIANIVASFSFSKYQTR